MNLAQKEAAARKKKIKAIFGTSEGEFGTTIFISHHLEEVEPAYWLATYGTETPEAMQVLESLVLVGSWSSEDYDMNDVLDFGLPNEISNYLLSARFEDGDVLEVTMES